MSDRERRLDEIQRMISDHSSQLPEGGAERLSGQFANMMADDAWEDDYELPSLVALGVFLVWLERNVLMWAQGFGIGSNGRGSITAFWREGEVRHTVDFLPRGGISHFSFHPRKGDSHE